MLPLTQERLNAREAATHPPFLTVRWHHALFEHYKIVNERAFASYIPLGFELDRHRETAYISVVSFRMMAMKLWGAIPLPFLHDYPQINVRVYIHRDGKPGVLFLRNYVSNQLATWGGRTLYAMPYKHQTIKLTENENAIGYQANLSTALQHTIEGVPLEPISGYQNDPSSLPFFLIERYPLYSTRGIRLCESKMVHYPWKLYSLSVTRRSHAIIRDLLLEDIVTPTQEVHFSPGVSVKMWAPTILY